MLDIRFQISTTSKFKDTKAHWWVLIKWQFINCII
jgi:hypothetical protein